MSNLLKYLFISLTLMLITACTPGKPYEIKSPCVSIESPNQILITPCIRRPANFNRSIV